jgi:hypothetical protein
MGTETKCRNENTYNDEEEKKQAPEYGKKIFEGRGSNPALDLNVSEKKKELHRVSKLCYFMMNTERMMDYLNVCKQDEVQSIN